MTEIISSTHIDNCVACIVPLEIRGVLDEKLCEFPVTRIGKIGVKDYGRNNIDITVDDGDHFYGGTCDCVLIRITYPYTESSFTVQYSTRPLYDNEKLDVNCEH